MVPTSARERGQLRHGVWIGAGNIHGMQLKAGCVSDFHKLDIASGKSVMRGHLDRRRIDGTNVVSIVIFYNVEIFQNRTGHRARPIPIADMDGLHFRRAIELYSVQDISQIGYAESQIS